MKVIIKKSLMKLIVLINARENIWNGLKHLLVSKKEKHLSKRV